MVQTSMIRASLQPHFFQNMDDVPMSMFVTKNLCAFIGNIDLLSNLARASMRKAHPCKTQHLIKSWFWRQNEARKRGKWKKKYIYHMYLYKYKYAYYVYIICSVHIVNIYIYCVYITTWNCLLLTSIPLRTQCTHQEASSFSRGLFDT